jgi:hypothetical protein
MSKHPTTPSRGEDRRPAPVAERPYDAAAAAPGYANVTGLVSTFALAAVVLVFLIAATAKTPSPPQKADMGLATILFAVGFLGCLLGAFAFAALAGAPKSVALTNSMLIASVVAVCLIAVLGGFEALANAFLHTAAPTFAFICAVTVGLSPIFVWFPLFNYEREARVAGSAGARSSDDRTATPEYEGWARGIIEWQRIAESLPETVTTPERRIIALLLDMTTVAMIAGGLGLAIHFIHVFGRPEQWAYYILGVWGLGYTGLVIVGALLSSTDPERRLTATQALRLNWIQVGFMFAMLSVLP